MHPPDEQRGVRRVVDIEPAWLDDIDNPVWTEADLLHFRRSGQTSGNDFALPGQSGDRVGPNCARTQQRLRGFGPQIVDDQRVARPQQLTGDRCADIPIRTDVFSNRHYGPLSTVCLTEMQPS